VKNQVCCGKCGCPDFLSNHPKTKRQQLAEAVKEYESRARNNLNNYLGSKIERSDLLKIYRLAKLSVCESENQR